MGTIRFKVKRVMRREDKRARSRVLGVLAAKRCKHPKDMRMKLEEFASKMSCKDGSPKFETAAESTSQRCINIMQFQL